MIFVDSHVHIYTCFDLELFFNSAQKNFQEVSKRSGSASGNIHFALLLTEDSSSNWFNDISEKIKEKGGKSLSSGSWNINLAGEDSLYVKGNTEPSLLIQVIAGRQIVTAEKIEVLALLRNCSIPNALPLEDTIEKVIENDAIPVIPWGAGKWLGNRGKIITDYFLTLRSKPVFLGDNGGRPKFWPSPQLFEVTRKRGDYILPGSDPLPLKQEVNRVGSVGFFFDNQDSEPEDLAEYLREYLRSGNHSLQYFGDLQKNSTFFKNQLLLRLFR